MSWQSIAVTSRFTTGCRTLDSDTEPNHIAVDETVIQLDDERWWLYAAVDPTTNDFIHVRLFSTRITQVTGLSQREFLRRQSLDDAMILVDNAQHLTAALSGLSLRFQTCRHRN
jgi:putative transposase